MSDSNWDVQKAGSRICCVMQASRLKSPLGVLVFLAVLMTPALGFSDSLWPSREAQLARRMKEGDSAQRLDVLSALARHRYPTALPILHRALSDEDFQVRAFAARLALLWEDVGASVLTEEWLSSKSDEERLLGLRLLALGPDARKAKVIASLLRDSQREIRQLAAMTLGGFPPDLAALASGLLLGALDDDEPKVRSEVARGLGRLGHPDSAVPLSAHLSDDDATVRVQVALALGALGDEAAGSALVAALGDPDSEVVVAVLRALAELGFAEATYSVLPLLTRSPFDHVSEQAASTLEALGTEAAWRGLISALEQPRARRSIVKALAAAGGRPLPSLEDCLRSAVGGHYAACARLWLDRGGSTGPIIEAVESSRLSLEQALELLGDLPDTSARVLALEALDGSNGGEKMAALLYLASQKTLPAEVVEPLLASFALRPNAVQTRLLLEALSHSEGSEHLATARRYLGSDDPVLAAAAAAAMVAGGASGIELSGLVQDERAAVSLGALDQLAENMDAQQADEIVRMLLEGCSGKTDELLALLGAIPADVEDSTVENLWSLLARSRDADRDPVLEALAIAHQDERLIASLKSMSDADRQKLAQLNHVYFSDVALALALLDDPNPRTAQVALSAIGHRGSGAEVDAAVGKIGSRPQNPQYLRAQILWTLADSVLRGNSHAVPEHLLSDSACRSAHILTRAGTLRLAVAMMKDCAGLPGEQSLRLDPDPRVRLVVAWAAWSRAERSSGIQDVLRHCRIYEPSALVARACTEALALEARQESRRSSSLLIRPIWTDGPAAGYPALLLVNARLLSVVADRSGRVSLPAGDVRSLDPGFYF